MENGVLNGGKEGKSQGIEGSAKEIDVWVWMRPHIRFCTIGNCDLSFLFSKHGAFQLRFHLFFF
jgi:hypothetical protein